MSNNGPTLLTLTDEEAKTLYDQLCEVENVMPDGDYKDDIQSIKEKLEGQL